MPLPRLGEKDLESRRLWMGILLRCSCLAKLRNPNNDALWQGSLERLPRHNADVRTLEAEPQCELQGSHFGSAFEAGDLAIVAALAVDARACTVVSAERVHGVVEDGERIHAELTFHALSDGDALRHAQIRIEPFRSAGRVA